MATAVRPYGADMTEAEWRTQVVDLATVYGWRCYFVEQSTRDIVRRRTGARVRVRNINVGGRGFPDLVLIRRRDRRLTFVELKRNLGPRGGGDHVSLGDDQHKWRADIEAVAQGVLDMRVALGGLSHTDPDLIPRIEAVSGPLAGVFYRVWRPADYDDVERFLR